MREHSSRMRNRQIFWFWRGVCPTSLGSGGRLPLPIFRRILHPDTLSVMDPGGQGGHKSYQENITVQWRI